MFSTDFPTSRQVNLEDFDSSDLIESHFCVNLGVTSEWATRACQS